MNTSVIGIASSNVIELDGYSIEFWDRYRFRRNMLQVVRTRSGRRTKAFGFTNEEGILNTGLSIRERGGDANKILKIGIRS